ncbi:DUF6461 domain-containing protein [Nonomuraea sp. NPDC050310]|uniref:DUF6461 domain-containing protein n=1 Tax=Nonomuraea sp. NPDC050310 TaxID=3154935 RepID=UPI0033DDEEC8
MHSKSYFHDILFRIDPHLTHHFGIAWIRGIDVEQSAHRLGARLDHATSVTLADPLEGAELDPAWGDYSSVYLIGEANEGDWTICMEVQGWRLIEPETLSSLSRNGGQVLVLATHFSDITKLFWAEDGGPAKCVDLYEAHRLFPHLTDGLPLLHSTIEDVAWDERAPEILSEGFVLAGRVTGEEITEAWLRLHHERYIVAHDTP